MHSYKLSQVSKPNELFVIKGCYIVMNCITDGMIYP